jgi:hypothetical protein
VLILGPFLAEQEPGDIKLVYFFPLVSILKNDRVLDGGNMPTYTAVCA